MLYIKVKDNVLLEIMHLGDLKNLKFILIKNAQEKFHFPKIGKINA
jgi:hypothetical protein